MRKSTKNHTSQYDISIEELESIKYLANIIVEGFLAQNEYNNQQQKSCDLLPSFDQRTSRRRK